MNQATPKWGEFAAGNDERLNRYLTTPALARRTYFDQYILPKLSGTPDAVKAVWDDFNAKANADDAADERRALAPQRLQAPATPRETMPFDTFVSTALDGRTTYSPEQYRDDPRVRSEEAAEARDQPDRGEGGEHGEGHDRSCGRHRAEPPVRGVKAPEDIAERRRPRRALTGEYESSRAPREQPRAEVLLELPYLMAHRGLRHVQLPCSFRHAAETRGTLKGPQSVEWRQGWGGFGRRGHEVSSYHDAEDSFARSSARTSPYAA